MPLGWFDNPRRRCPIGVDFGARCLRLLQLQRQGAGFGVVAASRRELPGDLPDQGPERAAALTETLQQALQAGPFRGRTVVSCLPAAAIQYKNLRLPPMPPHELGPAVAWEAKDRLKAGDQPLLVQYYDAGEVRQGEELRQEVIAMAVPEPVVEEHLKVLRLCGLKPLAVDVVPSALARAFCWRDASDQAPECRVILDVGYQSTKVVIARRGRVVFLKLIDVGGRKFDQAVAERLTLTPTEAAQMRRRLQREHAGAGQTAPLFGATRRENVERAVFESLRALAGELGREVGLCLRYYSVTFRGRRPESAALAGGEAHAPLLHKVLSEEAGLAVQPGRPLEGIEVGALETLAGDDPMLSAWAVATGLSLRGAASPARQEQVQGVAA